MGVSDTRRVRTVHFTAPRTVAIEDSESRAPGPEDVLIETTYSAVSSGTELLVYRGHMPEGMSADVNIPALRQPMEYPLAYGYAVVGRVAAVGTDVSSDWLDRRVFAFHPHATHAVVPEDEILHIPRACRMDDAVLFPSMETAVNFAQDGNPRVGERVVILGQGVVGLLTTAILSGYPLESLVTVDRFERRRALSRAFGASRSVDVRVDETARPSENGMEELAGTADLTYELSGNPEAIDSAIRYTGYHGRIVLGSWYGTKRAEVDFGGSFHRSRIRLLSSQVSTIDPALRGRWDKSRRAQLVWRMLERLQPSSSVITHRFPLEQADEAYRLLDRHPEQAVQIVFVYGDEIT